MLAIVCAAAMADNATTRSLTGAILRMLMSIADSKAGKTHLAHCPKSGRHPARPGGQTRAREMALRSVPWPQEPHLSQLEMIVDEIKNGF